MIDQTFDDAQPVNLSIAAAAGRTEIVFIEDNVPDLPSVLAGLRPGIEFVVLDSKANGLEQIAAHLQGRSGIDAVHIVSHGSEGIAQLGTASLSNASVATHAGALDALGAALSDDGDILFYGCDTGAGETGQALLQSLSTLTRADVAASNDATGAAALGGDWLLESQVGTIGSVNPFAGAFADAYAGVFSGTYGDSVVTTGNFMIAAARPGQSGTLWVNDGGVANYPWAGSGAGRELSFMINKSAYPATYADGLRGRFEYDTGDGHWHTLLVEYQDTTVQPMVTQDNGGTPAPYGATIRYVDERPNDATVQEMHIRFWNPVSNDGFTSSSFKVAGDLAPTGIGANTLNLWSSTAPGDNVATLKAIDTGTTAGGLYELVGQSEADLFALNGNMLVKGSGQLAAGQTATVTLRYYDAFGRNPDGTPIPGQGVEQMLTFTGRANPSGFGTEVHVNATTGGTQYTPQVATQPDGSHMITWSSASTVMAQKFDAAGAKVGAEFTISSGASPSAVVALDNGRYAVAYVQNSDNVNFRIVAADGTVGAAISGPSNAANYQWYPVMTKLDNGGFALAWSNSDNSWDIMSREFDADGVAVPGSESIVHTTSEGRQWSASIGTLSNGNYVVTWEAKDQGMDNSGSVMLRVMGASGPVGGIVTVAENIAPSTYAKVAGLTGGGFVVVYEAEGTTEGGVTDGVYVHNVYARIYDNAGNVASPAFLVNGDVIGNQLQAAVTGLNDGGFAIAWTSDTDPESNWDVFGRTYDADGTPRQDYDMLVNESGRGNYQNQVLIAPHGGSGFVATWADANADGVDNLGVITRIVDPASANHSPVLAGDAALDPILEDVVSLDVEDVSDLNNPPPNWGMDMAELIDDSGFSDADGDVFIGVAISGNAADPLTEGRWQYSNDQETQFWKDIGAVSASSALLLPVGSTTTYIRFVPAADFKGTPGGLTVHAIDETGVTLPYSLWDGNTETGQRLDLTALDGTSPVSNGVTWGAQVASVNDAPVIANLGSADNQQVAASAGAVHVDLGTAAVVTDVDSADFVGGALSVVLGGRQAGDVFAIETGGAVGLSAGMTAGSVVTVDNVSIGTIGQADGNEKDLVVLFNSGANAAALTKLIHALTFDAGPTAGNRHVNVFVGDGDGGNSTSSAATAVFTVTVNPTVTIGTDRAVFTAGEHANLTFTFSDVPSGFVEGDISVSGGTLGDFTVTANPKVYTATFTPNAGVNTLAGSVSIDAGKFTDAANNSGLASNLLSFTGDTAAPVVLDANLSITGGTGTGGAFKIGDVLSATWNNGASGDNNLDLAGVTFDLSQFGGSATAAATQVNGVWTATHAITAGAIDAAGRNASVRAEDTAGNATVRADSGNAVLDNVAPGVSGAAITLSGATGTGGIFKAGDTVTATWTGEGHGDLAAVGFNFSQFGGGSVAGVAANGSWSASYLIPTGLVAGGAGVTVSATDDAGNTGSHGGGSASVDAQRPGVTSITPATAPAASDSARAYTVVFSEAVSGVDLGDFALATTGSAAGTLAGISGSGTTWTVNIDHIRGLGTLGLTLKSGSGIADAAGNLLVDGASSAPAAVFTVTVNPTVTIGTDRAVFTAGEHANLTFTFSDVPSGFVEGDISVSGGTLGDFTVTANPKVYTATFTPNAGVNTLAGSVSIDAGKFTDAANNSGLASNLLSFTGDTAAPVVLDANLSITGGTGTGGAFKIGDVLSATWNNSASGDNNLDLAGVTFDLSQFGGSATAAATQVNGVWTATHAITAGAIDAADRNASVRAEDTAGNATVRADSGNAVLDNVAPGVSGAAITLSGATGTGGIFKAGDTVTATWTGEGHGDLAAVGFNFSQFGGGSVAGVAANGSWSASYLIPTGLVAGGAGVTVSATDDAGNTGSHGGGSASVDAQRPGVTSITPATAPAAGDSARAYTVVFSEAVSGVDLGDFALATTGSAAGTLAGISGSGTTWTVNIDHIRGLGTLGLTLKSGSGIADAAGNLLVDGASGAPAAVGSNAAPVISAHGGGSTGAVEVAEARTAVTTVTATDANQDTLSYSISGGADAALFSIDAVSGALSFIAAPLATPPADAGGNGIYDVAVTVNDQFGGSDSQALAVTVLADLDRDGIGNIHDNDMDNDGRPNAGETSVSSAYVNGATGPTGDGNGDGLADNAQLNVTSLQTLGTGTPYATVAVANGLTLTSVAASAAPASGVPRNVKLPLGQLEFTIGQVTPGGTVEVAVYVDAAQKVNSYYKLDNTDKWVSVAKSVTTVGSKTKITFDLTDGGVLDADGVVNGSISDPGGVAVLTPLITSNGGAVTATATVDEGVRAVTTVTASAEAPVVYTLGGADAALFEIDQATGVLRFRAAPDFDKPQDTGGIAHDNSYVVDVTATDSHGADTQTLTVNVADVATPPVDDPEPMPSTVDGVPITTGSIVNSDGGTSQVITVPVVQPGRAEQVGNNTVADIPLVTGANGGTLLSVQVPTGVGLQATGSGTPKAAGNSLADLIREIQAHTVAGSQDQASLTGGGSTFLSDLPASTPLLVQTIVPTSVANAAGPDSALVISGASASAGNPLTALVIDTRGLPAGSAIELQNVEFAAVIGEVKVTGGAGSQKVWGDGAAQHLVLGADDDVLHGGAGNDTVGSAGGNDRIYGDEGDDIVFGGQGDDVIDGGSGKDTLLLAGAGRAEYTLRVKDGALEVKHLVEGADGLDMVAGVETLRFGTAGQESDFNFSEAAYLVRLYSAAFDRLADTGGINYWIASHEAGMSLQDIADSFMGSQEAEGLYGGLSNEAFVASLYEVALHREGDAAGMTYWTEALDSGAKDRGDVLWGFAASNENIGLVGAIDTSIETI